MARIVVKAKSDQTIVEDTQASKIDLMQSSYVHVAISKEEVASLIRSGNNCIITLKNGQKIIIENFFIEGTEENNTLLLSGENSEYELAEFDGNGKFIDYMPVSEDFQIANSDTSVAINSTQQTAVNSLSTVEDDSPSLLKAGLAILAAEAVYLLAFNKDDDDHSEDEKIDILAPSVPTGGLDDQGKVISGKAEIDSVVYVADLNGNILGKATAGSDGSYKITLDQPITDGTNVIVYAVDQAGNKSNNIILTGYKDTLPPDVANAQINDSGDFVSGSAEAGTKVYLYAVDGKTIIGGPILVASDGSFSIPVSPPLKSGETAKLIVEDKAGNRSDASTVEIGKDTLAPEQPKFEVKKDGSSVKGTAEPNSKITITDATGKLIGTGQVDDKGNFEIGLNPALGQGVKGSIFTEDMAGNKSQPMNIIAGQDNIAPEVSTAVINLDGSEVSGKSEPGSKIEIRSKKDGSLLGSSTVGEDGTYKVKLSTALTDNTVANVYASDASGNRSNPLEVKGTKDTIAPSAPSLSTVYDDAGESKLVIQSGETTKDATPVFEGKSESNATIIIYQNGIAVKIVQANAKGEWTYTPESDLDSGKYSYTFSQTDASGNTSAKSKAFEFTVDLAETKELVADEIESHLEQDDVLSTQAMPLMDLLLIASTLPEWVMVEEEKFDIPSLLSENKSAVNHAEIDLGSLNASELSTDVQATDELLGIELSSSQFIAQSKMIDSIDFNSRLDLNELQNQSITLI